MSISYEVRKLVQSFITMEDVALGQSLVEGGIGQLGRLGMSASGPSVAFNVAARAVVLGAQMGTRSADEAAGAVSGIVPLAGETQALAEKMNDQAKALGERCSTLAIQGIELAGGTAARNPVTKEEWLGRQAPAGYTSAELAADTAFGTLQSLATMPLSMGMGLIGIATDGSLGDSFRKAVDASFDAIPGDTDQFESKALRQGLVSLALGSGMPVLKSTFALIEAAGRLALTDSRALHSVLSNGLRQARLLADQERAETVPGVPVSGLLRDSAREVIDNPPGIFLAALEEGPAGEKPRPGAILSAMREDRRALTTFFTVYPRILGLLGSDLSLLLAGGLADMSGTKAYIENGDGRQPATFILLDSLVGTAIIEDDETPLFSRATVYLAQDLSYGADRDVRGRDAALDRAESLFGEKVRERLVADVSLDSDVLAVKDVRDRDKRLRVFIGDHSDVNALSRQIDLCCERLALLEGGEALDSLMSAGLKMSAGLNKRIEILRAFTSLAASDVAMRGVDKRLDMQARSDFYAWCSRQ